LAQWISPDWTDPDALQSRTRAALGELHEAFQVVQNWRAPVDYQPDSKWARGMTRLDAAIGQLDDSYSELCSIPPHGLVPEAVENTPAAAPEEVDDRRGPDGLLRIGTSREWRVDEDQMTAALRLCDVLECDGGRVTPPLRRLAEQLAGKIVRTHEYLMTHPLVDEDDLPTPRTQFLLHHYVLAENGLSGIGEGESFVDPSDVSGLREAIEALRSLSDSGRVPENQIPLPISPQQEELTSEPFVLDAFRAELDKAHIVILRVLAKALHAMGATEVCAKLDAVGEHRSRTTVGKKLGELMDLKLTKCPQNGSPGRYVITEAGQAYLAHDHEA